MTTVIGDITLSLDGFVSGAGDGVERLHSWALASDDPVDGEVLVEVGAAGAVVMGRTTFDAVDSPEGWAPGLGYGARQDTRPPFFVVTSRPPERVRLADTHDFTFVTDGPAAAVSAAVAAAGSGDVHVMGGGALVGSCLAAGLLDRLSLHVAPEVLGAGTPLFEGVGGHRLERRDVRASAHALHVVYDVVR
ncbi:dihydrofolate reductase family protein [Nocardioides lijunqiniae]|uniref:dihydrofolate reductase family protein n=1 Tax=Nocardioides lijunqiniae TaxID=2760832 RepID=UPI001878DA79|nr:dihydrofolate reductase family protein [Nocardioides lijunqiniae]